MTRFAHIISAIDSHTAGEPARIILSGLPPIPGDTMLEKKRYMMEYLDHFRRLLMHEPRGHSDMFGVILTPPTTALSQYGVLFMDNAGYIDMCGHGLICTTTALIEIGMMKATEPETIITFDTPAGLVKGYARVEGNQVVDVSVANVSSFLYAKDVPLKLPTGKTISVDVSFGGNFFALVRAEEIGIAVHPDNISKLIEVGMMVKRAINKKLKVRHPTTHHIATIELTEIYQKPRSGDHYSKNITIFGNGQFDRSPSGTGTSATMAALYGRGELPLGVEYTNESIIGTRFKGKLVRETQVGEFIAVDPIITGEAYITGIQQFVVDPDDPFKYGFAVN